MKILIADDDPVARRLLFAMVYEHNPEYEVEMVEDGNQAWRALQGNNPPRLALLDWMMPGIDGIEICRKLRERCGDYPLIYSIVLTASDDQEKLVDALKAGAHDFQFKPVYPQELHCRLQVGRRLIEADDKNRTYAKEMESLAELRARQLIRADRLVALGTLSAGVAHEINNPVGFISGNAQIIEKMWPSIQKCTQLCLEQELLDKRKLQFVLDEMPDVMKGIAEGVQRVESIVRGLKTFARGDDSQAKSPVNINKCVEKALLLCRSNSRPDVIIEKRLCADPPLFSGHPVKIVQVLVNLINNAYDALVGIKGAEIVIASSVVNGVLAVSVRDNGAGIGPDAVDLIFDPFFTTKPVGQGTGLGLSIAYGIIQEHGGELKVSAASSEGAEFVIELPVQRPEHESPRGKCD